MKSDVKGVNKNVKGGKQKCLGGVNKNVNGKTEKLSTTPLEEKSYDDDFSGKNNNRSIINEEEEPPSLIPPDQFQNWAKRLREILRSKKPAIPVSNGSIKYWSDGFKSLWVQLNKDSPQIDTFLDGYKKNINKIERPIITNAHQLCKHYLWLVDEIRKLTDSENLPPGKIRRRVKREYYRHVMDPVPGKKGIFSNKSLYREFDIDLIGEMVVDDGGRKYFEVDAFKEEPKILTDSEGNEWTLREIYT